MKDKPPTMYQGETWVGFFYRYAEWAGTQMTKQKSNRGLRNGYREDERRNVR